MMSFCDKKVLHCSVLVFLHDCVIGFLFFQLQSEEKCVCVCSFLVLFLF